MARGNPHPLTPLPAMPAATTTLSLWLMLKVFSSGCTAMAGVEAVSNGVMAFRDDTRKNAKITLTIIIALLAILLLGIARCAAHMAWGRPILRGPDYESVLSMLTRAVMGHGWFYYVTIGSVLLVLSLSANTAFADFPRLTRAIAGNNYLPHVFLLRGRRLLYSWGIYVLVALTAVLLIVFGGVTDRLIPLYAIGAFLAFTLSQAGMVVHWWKRLHHAKGSKSANAGTGHRGRMALNALGAVATGITAAVVLVAKFAEGAWITALLVALMIVVMRAVKSHYTRVARETALDRPIVAADISEPIVVLPLDQWNRISEKALSFALSMSNDIRCVHVQIEDEPDQICQIWEKDVAAPLREAGKCVPKLEVLHSPYRYVLQPVVELFWRRSGNRGAQGVRAGAGTGGAALVGESAAQSARGSAEGDPAAARESADYCDQHSVVSGAGLGRLRVDATGGYARLELVFPPRWISFGGLIRHNRKCTL